MSTPEQNHQEDNENQRAERNARYYQKRTQATIQHRQHAEIVARARQQQAKATIQHRQHAEIVARARQQQRQRQVHEQETNQEFFHGHEQMRCRITNTSIIHSTDPQYITYAFDSVMNLNLR
jgi:hypothetical protein